MIEKDRMIAEALHTIVDAEADETSMGTDEAKALFALASQLLQTANALVETTRQIAVRLEAVSDAPSDVVEAIARGANPVLAWRRHRGMSQASLAAAVGITPPAMHRIERLHVPSGRPATRAAIARILGVPSWRLETGWNLKGK